MIRHLHRTLETQRPRHRDPSGLDGSRHICVHPTLDVIYSSNEHGCGVTACHSNLARGTLTLFQTVSSFPSDFAMHNTCLKIQITPNGPFLHAPNCGHNRTAGFAVDAATGRLMVIGYTPTKPLPQAFTLEPPERFLFSSGLESAWLVFHRITAETEQLELLDIYDMGKQAIWLSCAEL